MTTKNKDKIELSSDTNIRYDRSWTKEKNAKLICSCKIPSIHMYLPDHIGEIIADFITPISESIIHDILDAYCLVNV